MTTNDQVREALENALRIIEKRVIETNTPLTLMSTAAEFMPAVEKNLRAARGEAGRASHPSARRCAVLRDARSLPSR